MPSHELDTDDLDAIEANLQIETDVLAHARDLYPSVKNRNELIRRLIQRGIRARERDVCVRTRSGEPGDAD